MGAETVVFHSAARHFPRRTPRTAPVASASAREHKHNSPVASASALVITHETKRSPGAIVSVMFGLRGCDSGLKANLRASVGARSCTAFQVLTHLALLKPALQAWGGMGVSRPGAYAPGFAEVGPSGLVRASGGWRGFRSVVCASGLGPWFCWFGLPAFVIQA